MGAVYRDLFLYDPPKVDDVKKPAELDSILSGLRRRIMFIAGPDIAEQTDDYCMSMVNRDICPVFENTGVIGMADKFSQAVRKCYKGPKTEDGSPVAGGSGELDMDCFLSESFGLGGKAEDHKTAAEQCSNLVYDCYRTAYVSLRNSLNGRK